MFMRFIKYIVILAAFYVLPAAVLAVPSVTGSIPEPVKVTSVEGITEYRLANGLKVLLFPDPGKPTMTVAITYLVGSRHENYGESGMAHLLEHLVFKPTRNYSGENGTKTPKDVLDSLGARFNGSTTCDRTNYFISFPASDENQRTVLALEAERMINCMVGVDPAKAAEQLKTEMTVVRNEFEAGENSPFHATMKRTLGAAFEWSNYGKTTIGCKADIENVDIERLGAFYRNYYQPDNAVLLVAGKMDEAKTLDQINELFGCIPKPSRKLQKTYTVDPVQDGERLVTVRRVGDTPAVMIVYKTPAASDEQNASMELLAAIMASPPSGRLYKALVETRKAAMVFAFTGSTAEPGYLLCGALLPRGGNVDEVRNEMIKVLENVAKEPITAEEVERARREFLTQVELSLKDSSMLGIDLSEYIALGDWRMFFLNRDRVKAVIPENVQQAAVTYFKGSNRTAGQFIPTEKPDRAEVPAVKDMSVMMKDYKGGAALANGEAFDTAPAAIDSRTVRFTIPDGLKCAVVPGKTRGNAVSAAIRLHFGEEKALQGKRITGGLCGSMLMRGTENHTRQQIKDEFDRLKAQVSIGGSAEGAYVQITTVKENFAEVMKLVTEILRKPNFPAKEFAILVQENIAMIESQRSEPSAQARLALRSHMQPYPEEHVRYVGSFDKDIQLLKSSKVEDAKDFHRAFYGGSGEMAVAGDVDAAELKQLVNRLFGDWKPAVPYVRIPRQFFSVKPLDDSLETPDKANAFFIAGMGIKMRDDDPDYPAMMFANYMLGGGTFKNRLMQRIREKDGLSYGVGSSLDISSQDAAGEWVSYAILNPVNIRKLEAAFQEELAKALKDGFGEKEIAAARQGWMQGREVGRSREGELASRLARLLLVDRTMAFEDELEKKVAVLNNEQILTVLRKYFDPARLSIVKAGDFKNTSKPKK
jgi:zinc protease